MTCTFPGRTGGIVGRRVGGRTGARVGGRAGARVGGRTANVGVGTGGTGVVGGVGPVQRDVPVVQSRVQVLGQEGLLRQS
jgi:hypothetical protein